MGLDWNCTTCRHWATEKTKSTAMAEQQSSNFLIILCLVLAALLGSARSEDVATAPTMSAYPASGPTVGSSIPDVSAAGPITAAAAAPTQGPAMAMMAPAGAPMMAEAPAAAPGMAAAAAVAPAPANSVTATTGYAQRQGPPASMALHHATRASYVQHVTRHRTPVDQQHAYL